MSPRRLLPVLALAAAVLTACGGSGSPAGSTPTPTANPSGIQETIAPEAAAPGDPNDGPSVAWGTEPGRIELTTWGSSTCPELPTAVEWTAKDAATITLETVGGPACTMDLRPTTSVVNLGSQGAVTFTLDRTKIGEGGEKTTVSLEAQK